MADPRCIACVDAYRQRNWDVDAPPGFRYRTPDCNQRHPRCLFYEESLKHLYLTAPELAERLARLRVAMERNPGNAQREPWKAPGACKSCDDVQCEHRWEKDPDKRAGLCRGVRHVEQKSDPRVGPDR